MKRWGLNQLWIQFSLAFAGVVIVAAITLLTIGFLLRPDPPPDRQPNEAERLEFRTRAREVITGSLIAVVVTGTLLGIAAGVWMSRRMTAPLVDLAKGTETIGAGDLTYRVQPQGSQEMVALAQSFNAMTARLEEGERLRQNLLADVAHELRTPLTVLQEIGRAHV